jgi:hypothetical protein
MDCGRFLRTDDCSLEKDRFDYARVLVATSSLEVINVSDKILVDNSLVEVKVLEEWGFNIREHACLFEEGDNYESNSEYVEDHGDDHHREQVEVLVEKITDALAQEERELDVFSDKLMGEERVGERGCEEDSFVGQSSPREEVVVTSSPDRDVVCGVQGVTVASDWEGVAQQTVGSGFAEPRRQRHSSCPPGKERLILSRPWSGYKIIHMVMLVFFFRRN